MKKSNKKNKVAGYINYESLDKIGEVAVYYGFYPHKSPEIKSQDIKHAKNLLDGNYVLKNENSDKRLELHVEEKISLIRMYQENNMSALPQPVMMYFKDSFKSSEGSTQKNKNLNKRYCDLEILGSSKSIAEALLIQTAMAILKEEGYKDVYIEINSIGDHESINRFSKDLTSFYRKNINDLHTECRQLLKKDAFDLLGCKNEKCQKINKNAPKTMDFLSETSRVHFQEVLEYLESLGIPYVINNNLISNKKYCTETIFTINDDKNILAVGARYDNLSKKIGMKKEIQGVGISLLIKNNKSNLRKNIKKFKKPFASFIQLGFESKLMSLKIIEELRQAKIPLYLSLIRDKLGAQVSAVNKNSIPYTLIMCKKEAIENTVIVRNTDTYAQEVVAIDDLPTYMKKLEKKVGL